MSDSRIVLKGTEYTHIEYELRYTQKKDPHVYAGFPCDENGNLIMDKADVWGGEYFRVKDSEYYNPPEIKKLVSVRKYRNLLRCECREYFLDMPNGRGQIICPRCKRQYDANGCVINREEEKPAFRIIKGKEKCA